MDDEDGASEEDNTQDLVDRTRGELGSAIRNASSNAAMLLHYVYAHYVNVNISVCY